MIAIINTGENPSPTGKHRYRVQINRELITEFTHIREDGLELCLRRAADAVANAERDKCQHEVWFHVSGGGLSTYVNCGLTVPRRKRNDRPK